jgi:carbohydrate-binding DOMON domain-containing protein
VKKLITGSLTLVMVMYGGLALAGETISFEDPKGDDDGPGQYTYPTDAVYTPGSFDLTDVEIADKGDTVEVSVTVKAKIDDPWDSRAWDGNGFSLQMIVIHIDTDHKAGSGYKDGLPGFNVTFADDQRWDKALVISPQGRTRVQAEVSAKAAAMKKDILIPTTVSVRGRKLVARFAKKDLGADLSKQWGFQVLMQSNEGFPDKTDLLTRKVNEFGGQHRFGGGSDYDCDPHVMDLIAGKAQGDKSEKDAQHKMLGTFKCNPDGSGTRAVLQMVYPEG